MNVVYTIMSPAWRAAEAVYIGGLTAIGAMFVAPILAFNAVTRGLRYATSIRGVWAACSAVPLGNRVFTLVGQLTAPYAGSLTTLNVTEVSTTRVTASLTQRPWLHGPFSSIHALALGNLGEFCTGLVVMAAMEKVKGDGIRIRAIVTGMHAEYLKKARGTITATVEIGDLPTSVGSVAFPVIANLRNENGEIVSKISADWTVEVLPPKGAAAVSRGGKKNK